MNETYRPIQRVQLSELFMQIRQALLSVPRLQEVDFLNLANAGSIELKISANGFEFSFDDGLQRRGVSVAPGTTFVQWPGSVQSSYPHAPMVAKMPPVAEPKGVYGRGSGATGRGMFTPRPFTGFGAREMNPPLPLALMAFLQRMLREGYGVHGEAVTKFMTRVCAAPTESNLPQLQQLFSVLKLLRYPCEKVNGGSSDLLVDTVAQAFQSELSAGAEFEQLWSDFSRPFGLSGQSVSYDVMNAVLRLAYAIVRRELPEQMPDVTLTATEPTYGSNRDIWEAVLAPLFPNAKVSTLLSMHQAGWVRRETGPRWSQESTLSTGPAAATPSGRATPDSEPLEEADFFAHLENFCWHETVAAYKPWVGELRKVYRDTAIQAAAARHFEWDPNQSIEARMEEVFSVNPRKLGQLEKDFRRFLRSSVFRKPIATLTIEKKRAAFLVLQFIRGVDFGEMPLEYPGDQPVPGNTPQEDEQQNFWRELFSGKLTSRLAPLRRPSPLEARSWAMAWLQEHVPQIDAKAVPCLEPLGQLLDDHHRSVQFTRLPLNTPAPSMQDIERQLKVYDAKAWDFVKLYEDLTLSCAYANPEAPTVLVLFLRALLEGLLPGQLLKADTLALRSADELVEARKLWEILKPSPLDPRLARVRVPREMRNWLPYVFQHRLHKPADWVLAAFWARLAHTEFAEKLQAFSRGVDAGAPEQLVQKLSQALRYYGLHSFEEVYSDWLDRTALTPAAREQFTQVLPKFIDAFLAHELPGQSELTDLSSDAQQIWQHNRQVWEEALKMPIPKPEEQEQEVVQDARERDLVSLQRCEENMMELVHEIAALGGVAPEAADAFEELLSDPIALQPVVDYLQRNYRMAYPTMEAVDAGLQQSQAMRSVRQEFDQTFRIWDLTMQRIYPDSVKQRVVLLFLDGALQGILPGQAPAQLQNDQQGLRAILTEQQALWKRVLDDEQPSEELPATTVSEQPAA